MSDWREQEVENETRSRDINERIDESNESEAGTGRAFVCECSDGSVIQKLPGTPGETRERVGSSESNRRSLAMRRSFKHRTLDARVEGSWR